MNILHLHTELNLACGITRTIYQIVNNSSQEFKHHIISLGGNALNRFEPIKNNIKVESLNRHSVLGTVRLFFILLNYCKKNSIQIVHSHHRYFDTLVRFLKPFTKVKAVTSVQSKVFGSKILSYKSDILIACSSSIKNHLINTFKIDENRIKVVYNAVDLVSVKNLSENERFKNEINIDINKFIIGYVGRIDFKEKGVDILLTAFWELTKLVPDLHLLMVGEGQNNSEVVRFCEENKINTTLLPAQENIFDFYNVMDLVVLPSRVDPFPLSMLETGLMHKPFIGSKVDGIDELIEHEKTGLLFESGNANDLKIQILRILNGSMIVNNLAENLNKKVLDSYTVDKIIPQYEEIYLDVLRKS